MKFMYMKVNHIGIAVKDIEKSLEIYRDLLGLELERRQEVEAQNVITAFFPVGETHIELVQPTEGNVGMTKFLEKRGEGFHHICYEVDDIRTEIASLKEAGVEVLGEPKPGAEGLSAFLHPRDTHGLLIELVEKKEEKYQP